MKPDTLAIADSPGYSRLFADLLGSTGSASQFFLAPAAESVCLQIDSRSYDRTALCDILKSQHAHRPNRAIAERTIALLANANAVCLFAGQQAGLFGGPLLTQIKAIGVLLHARFLEQQIGRPVIPIFWIAADDHDFAEIDHTTVLHRNGSLQQIQYGPSATNGRPTWQIPIESAALQSSLAQLKEALGESEFSGELYDQLEQAYRPGESYAEAFASLLAMQLGAHRLLTVSPGDRKLKQLAIPFFHQLVESADSVSRTLLDTNKRLHAAGYHLQVEKGSEYIHLFHHQPARTAIIRDGDSFRAGDKRWSKAELLAQLSADPLLFSPDVISRPLLQSFLFPTLVQHGGPSEIAYLAQLNPLFELFSLPTPIHRPRTTATLLEQRWQPFMADHAISLSDLYGDVEQMINRVLSAQFPADLESSASQSKAALLAAYDQFAEQAQRFDNSIQDVAGQMRGKIEFAFTSLESKLFAAHKKKSKELREKIYRLASAVAPNKLFQERTLSLLGFQSRYGKRAIETLISSLDPTEVRHQIVPLSPTESKDHSS